jgi:hypothetical protein
LVAFAAEELGDLSLQGRLHQQLRAQTGDFFKDLRQLPILGKTRRRSWGGYGRWLILEQARA